MCLKGWRRRFILQSENRVEVYCSVRNSAPMTTANREACEEREKVYCLAQEERAKEAEGTIGGVMLGPNCFLMGLLALVLPAASQGLTVKTELAYFSCQPVCEMMVHVSRELEYTSGSCC